MIWRFTAMMVLLLGAAIPALPARADFSAGLRAYGQGDLATARMEWESSETGDGTKGAMAHYRLGLMLVHGIGVDREPDIGLAWLRKAGDEGLALAQLDLAELLFKGADLPQDYGEALKWSREAAKSGSTLARYYVGRHFDRGLGIGLDYHQALKHFKYAAEKGVVPAQRRLGQYLMAGIAVDVDPEQGLHWLELAAKGGDGDGQHDHRQDDGPRAVLAGMLCLGHFAVITGRWRRVTAILRPVAWKTGWN